MENKIKQFTKGQISLKSYYIIFKVGRHIQCGQIHII